MEHKIVLFDTSVIRGKQSEFASKFPKPEWIWTISETTDLELNRQVDDSHIRKKVFSNSKEFEPLIPRGEVLIKETNSYLLDEALEPGLAIQNDSYTLERLKAFNDPEALQKLKRRVKELEFNSEYFWKIIKIGEESNIHYSKVIDYVKRLNFDDNYLLTLTNGVSIIDLLRSSGEKFSDSCPSCYNLYIFVAFIRTIQKPKNAKKQFTVKINDTSLKITRTYVQDMVISIPYLHYISKFCTTDNGQANILKLLYPKYAEKIEILR
ncbi:hypothetical protein [Legionella longbeachae]|uniref:hypothetical protein n=1 Tax=Legionella longbeachae TaxID=450 RepID=UPI0012486431|nr:hypothetical protein [Legionella longbeachae]QEY50943.1 hypothetical protein FQU71_06575 [Legionella longbeachae]